MRRGPLEIGSCQDIATDFQNAHHGVAVRSGERWCSKASDGSINVHNATCRLNSEVHGNIAGRTYASGNTAALNCRTIAVPYRPSYVATNVEIRCQQLQDVASDIQPRFSKILRPVGNKGPVLRIYIVNSVRK